MRRIIRTLAFLSSLLALAATVWIILPAPAYFLWLISVLASEWSLAFGALGAVGCLCSLLICAVGGRRLWLLPAGAGGLAVLLALYPLASGLLAAHANGGALSLRQYSSVAARDRNGDADADGNATTHTFANVAGQPLQLDAYLPPAAGTHNGGAGVIVVHGGVWRAGARSDFPQWNRWLARQGFAVFDIDYRLAPQPNWQTATGDVKCAVLWIKQHAAEFHVAPDRLALLGRSAGGHLALLAAYTADDVRLPPSCASLEGDSAGAAAGAANTAVRAVVSFYGPTDLIWAYDNPANQRVLDGPATLNRFVGGDPHAAPDIHARFQLVSPDTHVNARTPPTLLIHGGHDQLVRRENMDILGAQLTAAGVHYRRVFLGYAQHGFDYNFNGWGAQVVRPILLDFLRANTQPR